MTETHEYEVTIWALSGPEPSIAITHSITASYEQEALSEAIRRSTADGYSIDPDGLNRIKRTA